VDIELPGLWKGFVHFIEKLNVSNYTRGLSAGGKQTED
jgi:hypothetical protein